jgi:hypothetical protein
MWGVFTTALDRNSLNKTDKTTDKKIRSKNVSDLRNVNYDIGG